MTPIPYSASRLTDLLGQSLTSYAGSIAPRVHNVQLATRKINGATVPPGGIFSFDDVVGDQTEAGGFVQAFGIISDHGVPETVKADAGGICQVATTLFQAVFWSGLPVTKHFHHLYWIAHYGLPPYGMTGLDATVDFAPVDFQFQNTTHDWIRVEATYDSSHVRVRIVGVDPGWKVTAAQPVIQNLLKVDRTPISRPDPTMPAGKELWIESAQDGFDVTVERTVTKGSQVIGHYVYTNHYEPAHNVKLVGTLGAAPRPSPSAQTTPASSPVAVSPTSVPTGPTAVPSSPTAVPVAAGSIRVPSLIGLPEARARQLVDAAGLQNTYANYQGPGDVPAGALNGVAVGSVLSQIPPPGAVVGAKSTVYLAVRKA